MKQPYTNKYRIVRGDLWPPEDELTKAETAIAQHEANTLARTRGGYPTKLN